MRKTTAKITTLLHFLYGLFPKTDKYKILPLVQNNLEVNYATIQISRVNISTENRNEKFGKRVRQGCRWSLIHFNLYSKYLTKEVLEGFKDLKIGQVIHAVQYGSDLVLLAKKEAPLQSITDTLTEIGRWYGMEMNVEKTKVMRISRQPSSVQIVTDQKWPQNVEYFNYVGR
jgi:hypothetical protein